MDPIDKSQDQLTAREREREREPNWYVNMDDVPVNRLVVMITMGINLTTM